MAAPGVQVENLNFSYSRGETNLQDVNMVAPRGTIYALLGPSGCCKTTLLRCIVGRLKPRSGTVLVFGYKPGTRECGIPGPNIGYMPQDLSLISQFTVRETLEYYAGFAQTPDHKGNYHNGKRARTQDLNSRIEFLLKLLDISEFEHAFTDRLSGGQKRRVSLAVAMINDPPLLILDEPTVGVDPIVRDAIWSYLVEQSKSGLTIIVTTHYIEEATAAHKVGFMRQGRILAEGNPTALMRQHAVPTLETLFLKLSRYDDVRTKDTDLPQEVLVAMATVQSNGSAGGAGGIGGVGGNPGDTTTLATIRVHNHNTSTTTSIQYRTTSVGSSGGGNQAETPFNGGGNTAHNQDGGLVNGSIGGHPHSHHPHHPMLTSTSTSSSSSPNSLTTDEYNNNHSLTTTTEQSSLKGASPTNNANSANNNSNTTTTTSSTIVVVESNNNAKANRTHSRNGSTASGRFLHQQRQSTKAGRTYSVHGQAHRVGTVQKVSVLCRKHRLRLFRRVPELMITMLLPALEVALFCLCMGRDPTAIQMAVCNQENPPLMSMFFLKSIDPDFIQLKYYKTPEEAINSVRNADTYSAIVLAKNFTSSMRTFAQTIWPNKYPPGDSGVAAAAALAASTTLARILQHHQTPRGLPPGSTTSAILPTTTTTERAWTPRSSEATFGSLDTPPVSTTGSLSSKPMELITESSILAVNTQPITPGSTGSAAAAAAVSSSMPGMVTVLPINVQNNDMLASSSNHNTIGGGSELASVDDSIIKIYYDGSNALHVNIIRRELFSALFRFVDRVGKMIGSDDIVNRLPIKFEKPIYGSEKTDMVEFVGPGLMVFIVFFATMSITSMAFLSERREGTLERSLIVGMTPMDFIISQIINITILLIVQITLTVVMGFWIFSFPMKGSYTLAVIMMFLQGLCGMTYGLMLSAICTNEMTALMLGAGSQLMFCFITGIFWPVDTMIPALRYLSYMLPQTLPMESFRHILIRGFDITKPAVFNGYLISIGWVFFFLLLAILIFRWR